MLLSNRNLLFAAVIAGLGAVIYGVALQPEISGVRWAEMMRLSQPTSSSSSVWTARFMVGQSDWDPMMMPTSGGVLLMAL